MKKMTARKKRQTDIPPPYQDPLSEPPLSPPQLPLSDPPESHEPLSEPPESQDPLSDPPESHEPLSEPLEFHHESLPLPEESLPPPELSNHPLLPLFHQLEPVLPLPEVPPVISPDTAQIAERMQKTSATAKKGAARLIRFMSCLLLRRGICGGRVIPLSRDDETPRSRLRRS
jgi:hypothetical protein